MACILLDIDGVLHVSGEPIPGAVDAVAELRDAGHALRFVSNNSTRPRARLAEELRRMEFTLEDLELQTPAGAAARELAGKRVLALAMTSIVPDLDGLELVGHDSDAVLIGGCDETLEPNQVFSYMNLARAFGEIQLGASLYCLHKNKWWQTSRGPMLDSGAFVAGLEYATGVEATVLGKPSPSYFAAALDVLDAEPELTWLVTDDIESDIRGARLFGMRTALVRTGKFRPESLESAEASPDIVVSSLAQFPALLEDDLTGGFDAVKVGVDLIEIERVRRALERPGFRERCFTEAERAYCESRADPAQSYAARFAGKEAVGKALGCGVRFTWKEVEIVGRPKPGVSLSGRTAAFAERVSAGAIDLSMTHSRELAAAICVVAPRELARVRAALHGRRDARRRGAVSRVSRRRFRS